MRHTKLRLSADIKARAKEYAYQHRTTVSKLLQKAVKTYAEHGLDRVRVTEHDTPGREARINFRADESLWSEALLRSIQEGDSIASLLRRHLDYISRGVK